jgi:hypothetical protein
MKTRPHADYYKRILSTQSHPLKRLDASASIVKYPRDQQIMTSGSASVLRDRRLCGAVQSVPMDAGRLSI